MVQVGAKLRSLRLQVNNSCPAISARSLSSPLNHEIVFHSLNMGSKPLILR